MATAVMPMINSDFVDWYSDIYFGITMILVKSNGTAKKKPKKMNGTSTNPR